MAIVTALTGSPLPLSSGTSYTRSTIVSATSVSYVWTSASGNLVTLLGNFTYPGGTGSDPVGTVDEIRFDEGGDGITDMTVVYSPSLDVSGLLVANSFNFSSAVFGQSDTMTLGGTMSPSAEFAADGAGSNGVHADTLTITGSGFFIGDERIGTDDGFLGAIDTITINSTLGEVRVAGDVESFSLITSETMTGGNDIIEDISAPGSTHIIYGDAERVSGSGAGSIVNGGDDTITGLNNALIIYGDAEQVFDSNVTINGGADIITGGAGDDIIYGDVEDLGDGNALSAGSDVIKGGGGNDIIYGDVGTFGLGSVVFGGDDVIGGDDGDDFIYEQSGTNELYGGADNDTINGGVDSDLIDGGTGIDTADYTGTNGAVIVTLGAGGNGTATGDGADVLRSIENIIGSDFNDTLTGNDEDNVIEGGDGDDMLEGGTGKNTASYASTTSNVTVSLAITVAQDTVGAGTDTLSNFSNLIGGTRNDTLTGTGDANIIEGGGGFDTLFGGGGNDTLRGGDAPDTLYGGNGNDALYGGDSNDQMIGGGGIDSFDGGLGSDTIDYAANTLDSVIDLNAGTATFGGVLVENFVNVENFLLGSGNDTVIGDDEDNTLSGNDGDDVFIGGAGADEISGGGGIDTASYATAGSSVAAVLNGVGTLGDALNDRLLGIDVLIGSAHADTLTGDGFANTIQGGAGADVIDGKGGLDKASGGTGNDIYYVDQITDVVTENAGEGTDFIYTSSSYQLAEHAERLIAIEGEAGAIGLTARNFYNNIVIGNSDTNVFIDQFGRDTFVGGGGADFFRFIANLDPVNNVNRINDFNSADDQFQLQQTIYTDISIGILAANEFKLGTAATDADDRIIYDSANGVLFYDPDGTGATAQIEIVNVVAGTTITADDFQIF